MAKQKKSANDKSDLIANAIADNIKQYEIVFISERAKFYELERNVAALKQLENPNSEQAQQLSISVPLSEQTREALHYINGFIMELWQLLRLVDERRYESLFESYRREARFND